MRILNPINRRKFGALLGAKLAMLAMTNFAFAGPKNHQIVIRRFKFEPSDLKINVGDTVTWENQDTAPHTATSKDDMWDTDKITKSQQASITFNDVGEHDYYCLYHPHMKAKIAVCEA